MVICYTKHITFRYGSKLIVILLLTRIYSLSLSSMLTLANALIISIGVDAGVQFEESIDATKTNWSNMRKYKEKEKHAASSFLRLWGSKLCSTVGSPCVRRWFWSYISSLDQEYLILFQCIYIIVCSLLLRHLCCLVMGRTDKSIILPTDKKSPLQTSTMRNNY